MEQTEKYFLQFILNKGVCNIETAVNFLKKIDPDFGEVNSLKKVLMDINKAISPHSFKILEIVCEVTGEEMIVFTNTKADEISKLQGTYSPIELEYFDIVMQEIAKADERRITYPRCINLASTLSSHLSKDNGQNTLQTWIEGGYFVQKAEYVYLGPRVILEFASCLKDCGHLCGLCSELVFTGQICGSCDHIFHSYCLEKYFRNHGACPDCKNDWEEVSVFQGSQASSQDDDDQ